MPPGAHRAEFPLAHLVAFQYAVFQPIFSGNGIHNLRNFDSPAVSPRQGVHAVHYRRRTVMNNHGLVADTRERYRYDGAMTGASPFASDVFHAVSKRSVEIIGQIRYETTKL